MPPPLDLVRSSRRPDISQLDSLTSIRGIAAWWVVLFHFEDYIKPYIPDFTYRLVEKGYLAVDLFFCLSGFVIFLNYGSLNVKDAAGCRIFYLKRLARIYPLHLSVIFLYLGLVGVVMLSHHHVPPERFSIESLLLNLFLIQDWNTLKYLSWNIPAWSISAEFAAYLLFPLLTLIVRPVSNHLWYGVIVIFGALFLLNVFYYPGAYDLGAEITTFGVIRCASQFAIGAVLAAFFMCGTFNRGLFVILFATAFLCVLGGFFMLQSILIPIGWAALVLGLALHDGASRLLRLRWLIFIGEISYATYMVHYFVRDVFKLALVRENQVTPALYVAFTFLVILISSVFLYRLVEKPAQKMITKAIRT